MLLSSSATISENSSAHTIRQSLAVYCGDELATHKRDPAGMPGWRVAVSKAYGMDAVRRYRAAPEAAESLVEQLVADQFDVATIGSVPGAGAARLRARLGIRGRTHPQGHATPGFCR